MVSAQAATPLDRRIVIAALGVAQIFAWGTSFYFPAVFAEPIVRQTGWSLGYVVGGTSIGLLVAGLISPQVGKIIDKRGGRPVLLVSSLCYAAGLAIIGLAPALPVYLAAWVVLGIGMGTGLYDAVFAALGRMYGSAARQPIASLTLFGGFASTVCWPLSAFMIDRVGWRAACFAYAALHLAVSLPLQIAVLRRGSAPSAETLAADAKTASSAPIGNETLMFGLLALALSLAAGIGSIIVVHLLIFLQARGADFTAAVALGTLFGPAQVGARLIDRLFGARYHPIWTMIASCVLMALGLVMLYGQIRFLALVIVLYAAGYGIFWIGRGTLPLALFGPVRFPSLMGKLAFPSLIVQALAPSAGALMIEAGGPQATIGILTIIALINLALIGALWLLYRLQSSAP